jgi:hypothetical protein
MIAAAARTIMIAAAARTIMIAAARTIMTILHRQRQEQVEEVL